MWSSRLQSNYSLINQPHYSEQKVVKLGIYTKSARVTPLA